MAKNEELVIFAREQVAQRDRFRYLGRIVHDNRDIKEDPAHKIKTDRL